jgi:hypothetical protein
MGYERIGRAPKPQIKIQATLRQQIFGGLAFRPDLASPNSVSESLRVPQLIDQMAKNLSASLIRCHRSFFSDGPAHHLQVAEALRAPSCSASTRRPGRRSCSAVAPPTGSATHTLALRSVCRATHAPTRRPERLRCTDRGHPNSECPAASARALRLWSTSLSAQSRHSSSPPKNWRGFSNRPFTAMQHEVSGR